MKPLRFGIMGTGSIAQNFVIASRVVEEMEVAAVASRSKERGAEFAGRHGIAKSYGSYEELVADPDIDIVYVATPHPAHLNNIRMSVENGKHVLCEKPITVNARDAELAVELARTNGVFLMEGYWTVFLPAFAKFKELVGELRNPRIMRSELGFSQTGARAVRKADPELAGGALLDLGVYNLLISSEVFGYEGELIDARAGFNIYGTDAYDAFTLEFPGGEAAYGMCTLRGRLDNKTIVYGEDGCVTMHQFNASQKVTLDLDGAEPVDFDFPFEANGYEYELRHVCACVNEGKGESDRVPHAKSLAIMRLCDQIREQIGLRYDFEQE